MVWYIASLSHDVCVERRSGIPRNKTRHPVSRPVDWRVSAGEMPPHCFCISASECPENTKHLYNICTMLADVVQMLYKCILPFVSYTSLCLISGEMVTTLVFSGFFTCSTLNNKSQQASYSFNGFMWDVCDSGLYCHEERFKIHKQLIDRKSAFHLQIVHV